MQVGTLTNILGHCMHGLSKLYNLILYKNENNFEKLWNFGKYVNDKNMPSWDDLMWNDITWAHTNKFAQNQCFMLVSISIMDWD